MLGQSFRVTYPNIKTLAKTKRYETRRRQQLEEFPLCKFCLEKSPPEYTAATVCDHVIPHRGDEKLFLEGDLQSLCATCHSVTKQSEETLGYSQQIGADGWPKDTNHPSNTGLVKVSAKKGMMSKPPWFRPSHIPLYIVCGPPAGGKSTYVAEHIKDDERLICFDTIATKLFGTAAIRSGGLTASMVGDVLRVRNDMLGDLMWAKAKLKWSAAWLIVSEPTREGRIWWHERLSPKAIYMALPPAEVCRERVKARCRERYTAPGPALKIVDEWFAKYTPREGDVMVHTH